MLILGNSITVHGECEYWWEERGMASTQKEKDYVNVLAELLSQKTDVNMVGVNFYQWEVMEHDRVQCMYLLNNLLDYKWDYVIFQLGENISDTKTLKEDSDELITYIRSLCSDANLIWLGNFWENEEVEFIKKTCCAENSVTYVSLEDMYDKENFQLGKGGMVWGSDEQWHLSEHEGVNRHPGDRGMEMIAIKLYSLLEEN